jgi:hypothetical protein
MRCYQRDKRSAEHSCKVLEQHKRALLNMAKWVNRKGHWLGQMPRVNYLPCSNSAIKRSKPKAWATLTPLLWKLQAKASKRNNKRN